MLTEVQLLQAIQDELDGKEWSAETLDAIAEYMRMAGYTIRDLHEMPDYAGPMPTGAM